MKTQLTQAMRTLEEKKGKLAKEKQKHRATKDALVNMTLVRDGEKHKLSVEQLKHEATVNSLDVMTREKDEEKRKLKAELEEMIEARKTLEKEVCDAEVRQK